jgi:hypothetical protein
MTARTLLLVLLCAGCATPGALLSNSKSSSTAAQFVGLCDVVAIPDYYHQRTIGLKARVNSDGREYTMLVDDRCEGVGIALIVRAAARGDAGVKRFYEVLYRSGEPGTVEKEVSASFIGVFLSTPDRVPSRSLVVETVNDVTATMRHHE